MTYGLSGSIYGQASVSASANRADEGAQRGTGEVGSSSHVTFCSNFSSTDAWDMLDCLSNFLSSGLCKLEGHPSVLKQKCWVLVTWLSR